MKFIRIIPRIDIKDYDVIKSICFEGVRVVGRPEFLLRKYYQDGADEIIYMDFVASLYRRNFDFDLLKRVTEGLFVPLTVGGGMRTLSDIKRVLRAGADKVAINTAAVARPDFIKEAVAAFGSQCIVLSVEAKKIFEDRWEIYTNAGRERTGINLIDWIKKMIEFGVGEILLSSVDNEGLKLGYEWELIEVVRKICPVPLIVHGGAGQLKHLKKAIDLGADAVSAASIYHYNLLTIKKVKKYLKSQGVSLRLS